MKIAIIGYSGSGKSTLARKLAEKYDLSTVQVKSIVYKAMDRLEKHM